MPRPMHATAYEISIRSVTTGAAIIAGGRLYTNEALQPQIVTTQPVSFKGGRKAGMKGEPWAARVNACKALTPFFAAVER